MWLHHRGRVFTVSLAKMHRDILANLVWALHSPEVSRLEVHRGAIGTLAVLTPGDGDREAAAALVGLVVALAGMHPGVLGQAPHVPEIDGGM